MSRINKFQEGYGPEKESWYPPKKKRKNNKKGFRLPKLVKSGNRA